ncbi:MULTISPECIES: anthranilate phosphoribosyltransferase [Halorhodospira]|uniref:anthranilate phosphoribosyltransferase n=1 Tax=Halorhodospira TaxID=85108 RepID=UPI001EE7CD66|nr:MULTISPECIES: anthranilate phosphoribosyltransferase [Halorhodospira]MCG5528185.1 anthranilate phosphoribosyltransferase [Halorhodospira halophila]MCG5543842.1 anthranilate phosphoribosyltransferase [Halorhodospira sp. 9628]
MSSEEEALRGFGKIISRVARGEELSREEAADAYRQVILNEQPELQQGAFLAAHQARGPTTEEFSGAWDALDAHDTVKIHPRVDGPVGDIVGTGSDSLKTVNASTPAALIAAACGLPVAKKGARLVTGVSGASDVLERLGVDLEAPMARAEACLEAHGIGYLPGEAFLRSGWARLIQRMRFTSAFNIVGPLAMPCARTSHIVIGAYSPGVCDQLVAILREIGMQAALAPFGRAEGEDPRFGMDEVSPCGPTRLVQLKAGRIDTFEVTPADFGLPTRPLAQIASSNRAEDNAQRILATLEGRYDTPEADFFAMNAAALLWLADRAPSPARATEQAKEALATGGALKKLDALCRVQGGVGAVA